MQYYGRNNLINWVSRGFGDGFLTCIVPLENGDECSWGDSECISDWCHVDADGVSRCKARAPYGEYCGKRDAGLTGDGEGTKDQHCEGSLKCGQFKKNDYRCCDGTYYYVTGGTFLDFSEVTAVFKKPLPAHFFYSLVATVHIRLLGGSDYNQRRRRTALL